MKLQKGDKGQLVSDLQKAIGLDPVGVYGPKTVAGVQVFQFLKGLPNTGIADEATLKAAGILGGEVKVESKSTLTELPEKLSANFSMQEFTRSDTAKRRGIDNNPSLEHAEAALELFEHIVQPIRDHFGTSIFLSSGYRSHALNKAIGGSQTSQHSKGEAVDIDMDDRKGPENEDVFHYIRKNLPFDQLIWEFGDSKRPDWVHVSYKKGGPQRGQILAAKRNSAGKTYYETWKA
ncbi:D-Ala-D-Ala carboxypeptidase family metallohydrolase [bacterium]|nr:D-Ala-D-Ala carboxypeptidase family metallohydrolase [bacterium]